MLLILLSLHLSSIFPNMTWTSQFQVIFFQIWPEPHSFCFDRCHFHNCWCCILISPCCGKQDWDAFLFASTCAVLGFWICSKAGPVAALSCTFPGCVGSNHMDWALMLLEFQAEARQTQQIQASILMNFIWIISENVFLFCLTKPIMCPQQPINGLRVGLHILQAVEDLLRNFTLAAS